VSYEPSLARQGLDLLLQVHPSFDLVEVDWQLADDGPWVLVTLGQPSEGDSPVWAKHHYAIWKFTGAVYGVQHDGAVTDDPLLVP
jgi:hypothetical protein